MLKKEKYQGFTAGLYKRNESFLILSAMIFFASLFIGYLSAGIMDQFMGKLFNSFKESVSKGEIQLTTFSIFTHNLYTALLIYGGGLLFGVLTALFLFVNGAFIGYAASKFPLGDFIIYTLPHGIFEIAGIIIVGAAGFRLANGLMNFLSGLVHIKRDISIEGQIKYLVDLNVDEFRESLILFAIAVALILLASIIEANLTLALGNYIKSVI